MKTTNFLPLGISFRKIDCNSRLFQKIYTRDSYTDASYAFATFTNEKLTLIGNLLQEHRDKNVPQPHTEKKVRSFISRFNMLVHEALAIHPTHDYALVLCQEFCQLVRSIEDSRIVMGVKHYLRQIVEYFAVPYSEYLAKEHHDYKN